MRKYVYLYVCMCAFWFYNIRENNRMVSTAWIQMYMFYSHITVHLFVCVRAFYRKIAKVAMKYELIYLEWWFWCSDVGL